MTWHAEIITLTLRRYEPGKSFEARDRFTAVATVHLKGGKRAYVSAFLADSGNPPIRKRDWIELGLLLRDQFGIQQVESERHAADRTFDTSPAPL